MFYLPLLGNWCLNIYILIWSQSMVFKWHSSEILENFRLWKMINSHDVQLVNWTGNTLVKVSDRCDTYLRRYERVKQKMPFSRKFDLWPDLTRSNVDLGLKTACAIVRSRRGASTVFFSRSSTTIRGRSPGGSYQLQPPPPLTVRVMRNALTGRGLKGWSFRCRDATHTTVSLLKTSWLVHSFTSWSDKQDIPSASDELFWKAQMSTKW